MVQPLIVGNWKMNGSALSIEEFGRMVSRAPEASARGVELAVCPPVIMMVKCVERATVSPIRVGAQDCHPEPRGAHTGDVSAEMIASFGGKLVIVGHSERRSEHHEDDALVARKAAAAVRADLDAIVCIGETEAERDAGETLPVLSRQLENSIPEAMNAGKLIVAYEPVWAIGTGRTPSAEQIAEAHGHIRNHLLERFSVVGGNVPVLYGGSVKPDNAKEILAIDNVNGALVGGASLKAADFMAIAAAAPEAI